MFSTDKSVANNTKIGSRLVADFAIMRTFMLFSRYICENKMIFEQKFAY